jgi:hypothetical protein
MLGPASLTVAALPWAWGLGHGDCCHTVKQCKVLWLSRRVMEGGAHGDSLCKSVVVPAWHMSFVDIVTIIAIVLRLVVTQPYTLGSTATS